MEPTASRSRVVGANNNSPLRIVYIKNVFLPLQKKTIMSRKEIVEKAKQAIRSVEPDAEIILFGSEARGDARPDSDIDLLVLLSGDKKSVDRELEISGQTMLLEIETGVNISPKIYLKKDWENRPFVTPFYLNVMREGIVL
jgi:predicted nucleotidyltransferase